MEYERANHDIWTNIAEQYQTLANNTENQRTLPISAGRIDYGDSISQAFVKQHEYASSKQSDKILFQIIWLTLSIPVEHICHRQICSTGVERVNRIISFGCCHTLDVLGVLDI